MFQFDAPPASTRNMSQEKGRQGGRDNTGLNQGEPIKDRRKMERKNARIFQKNENREASA